MTKKMIRIIRGIERVKGDEFIRCESGEDHTRSKLESDFGKKVVSHWLKTGVLEEVSDG